jgi:hypothetical protein
VDRYLSNTIWFFIALYSINIDIPRLGTGPDISRYCKHYFIGLDFLDLGWEYFFNDEVFDFINPLFQIIAVNISFDYRVLLLFYGLFFGFFYSRNFKYFFDLINKRNDLNKVVKYIFTLVLLMILPFYDLNGFRFWSAMQILVYAMLVRKDFKLVYLFLAALTHFSFWFIFFLYVLSNLLSKTVRLDYYSFKLLKYVLIINILSAGFSINILLKMDLEKIGFLSEDLTNRIAGYTNKSDETIQNEREFETSKHSYVNWPNEFTTRLILIMGIAVFWGRRRLNWADFSSVGKNHDGIIDLGQGIFFITLILLLIGLFQPFRFTVFAFVIIFFLLIHRYTSSQIMLFLEKLLLINGIAAFVVYMRYVGEFAGARMLFGGLIPAVLSDGDIRIIDVAKIFIPSL